MTASNTEYHQAQADRLLAAVKGSDQFKYSALQTTPHMIEALTAWAVALAPYPIDTSRIVFVEEDGELVEIHIALATIKRRHPYAYVLYVGVRAAASGRSAVAYCELHNPVLMGSRSRRTLESVKISCTNVRISISGLGGGREVFSDAKAAGRKMSQWL